MDPKQSGLTLTAAVGDKSLYRAKGLLGGGARGKAMVMSSKGIGEWQLYRLVEVKV